jgi:HTH-type transcriptional regulator/antitoxin HigA
MSETANWVPQWAVMPGEILVEALEERGMTQSELGRRMARPLKTISEIATGKAAITPETAIQLERALGISAAIWLGLEIRYREVQARIRDREELEDQVEWLRRFPVSELIRRGVLGRNTATPEQAGQLLAFFRVSSPAGWEQHWGQIAANYRMSEAVAVSPYAIAAWLCEADREAEELEVPALRLTRLRELIVPLRELSRAHVFAGAVAQAQGLLRAAGVGLLLVDGFRGAPASGAVRWIRRNPWIILTLRYGTDDQFWFSLFHELGHLLEGGRRRELVEELADRNSTQAEEQAANAFAREALIPEKTLSAWLAARTLDRGSIKELAAGAGVSPGIVVGRLQRDGVASPQMFNDLKRSVRPPRAP